MTTYLGKSCSFCLPRVPFVNCRQFMYLVISLLVLRAGYGIWLYQFLIIAYLFTLLLCFVNVISVLPKKVIASLAEGGAGSGLAGRLFLCPHPVVTRCVCVFWRWSWATILNWDTSWRYFHCFLNAGVKTKYVTNITHFTLWICIFSWLFSWTNKHTYKT